MSTGPTASKASSPAETTGPTSLDAPADLARRHLQFGWWSLLTFIVLGLLLEALHGFKIGAYLNVPNATRRLMWTLAHAHGTLLGLVHLGFAFTLRSARAWPVKPRDAASVCLCGAGVLIPGGFFLGGVFVYEGDPGLGIVLVPVGGALLLPAVLLAALGAKHVGTDDPAATTKKR